MLAKLWCDHYSDVQITYKTASGDTLKIVSCQNTKFGNTDSKSFTMTLYWARWRLQLLASRLFVQPFVQAKIKENVKAPCHWHLWVEPLVTSGFPSQRTSNKEKFPLDVVIMWCVPLIASLIASFMGQTWGPSGADRTQVGPMLAPWIMLSGVY